MADSEVSQLLFLWRRGDRSVLDRLTPLIYRELKRLAAHYLGGERNARTLQPTALVHELYIRMVEQEVPCWEGRSHFFAVAGQIMRQILVDHARARNAAKRGGGKPASELELSIGATGHRSAVLLDVDIALGELERIDPRKARMLELRLFAGMKTAEVADVTGASTATVGRELRMAEAWLRKRLAGAARRDS